MLVISSPIVGIGVTVMPGLFIGTRKRLMPLCFGASGSVRRRPSTTRRSAPTW
jgi:hypothetical protein